MPTKCVPLSPRLAARFSEMRAALNAAAAPFTGSPDFALSPDTLYALPEATAESDRLMRDVDATPVRHSFVLIGQGGYAHELRW